MPKELAKRATMRAMAASSSLDQMAKQLHPGKSTVEKTENDEETDAFDANLPLSTPMTPRAPAARRPTSAPTGGGRRPTRLWQLARQKSMAVTPKPRFSKMNTSFL